MAKYREFGIDYRYSTNFVLLSLFVAAVRQVFPDATVVDIRGHMRQKLSNAVKILKKKTGTPLTALLAK